MNAPARIDVLAVMRELARLAFEAGADEGPEGNEVAYERYQDAVNAIDAVNELIEAVAEFRRRRSASAEERMYGALARVQGRTA